MPPRTITEFAPAKINLTLHVPGQRADGYHLLDSLVVFASVGDQLTLTLDGPAGLGLSGPEAAALPEGDDNLVLRVARQFWMGAPLSIQLEKHLPVASGIGGGSADAAACFRGILHLLEARNEGQGAALMTLENMTRLLRMGADVPMCLIGEPAHVTGIGEGIAPVEGFPHLPIVLVNPRVPVSTPEVFRTLTRRNNSPMDPLPADLSQAGGADRLAGPSAK